MSTATRIPQSWHEVTRNAPCPSCGKPDWCEVAENGELVRCMRPDLGTTPSGFRHVRDNPDGGRVFALVTGNGAPVKPSGNGRKRGKVHPTIEAVERAAAYTVKTRHGDGYTLAHRYKYPDGAAVLRFESPDDKTFLPIHRNRDGFKIGDPPGKFPLYHRDELTAGIVCVAEGEKACDALRSIGVNATTSAHGSKSAHKAEWLPLAGRDVVIWPDADDNGEVYARAVTEILHGLGCTVRIMRPDGLADGEDAHDWIEQRDAVEPDDLRAEIERMAGAAEVSTPDTRGAEYPLTDYGNAQRFGDDRAGKLLYCHERGQWFAYTGKRWQPDNTGAVMRAAKWTVRNMHKRAAAMSDDAKRRALTEFALRCESASRLKAVIELARDEIPVRVSELDADPMLLNVNNGSIDLTSMRLRPHDPTDRITRICPVDHDPDAEAPTLGAFLARTFADDGQLIGYVRRLLGYCATGSAAEQILAVFHGEGANGKSTLLDAIGYVLGDYADTAAPDLLMQRHGDEHPCELADLSGKRLVFASESEKNRKLKVQTMKRLTGDSEIKARFMRQDYFSFARTFKIILATNSLPAIDEDTEAVWRRLRLIPFTVVIPREERDPDLLDKLKAEGPGILRWLLDGCAQWHRDGLGEPQAVSDATGHYRAESDPVAAFVADCCIEHPDNWCASSALRREYEKWCSEQGDRPIAGREFTDGLKRRGYTPARRHAGRGWDGVGLRNDDVFAESEGRP